MGGEGGRPCGWGEKEDWTLWMGGEGGRPCGWGEEDWILWMGGEGILCMGGGGGGGGERLDPAIY